MNQKYLGTLKFTISTKPEGMNHCDLTIKVQQYQILSPKIWKQLLGFHDVHSACNFYTVLFLQRFSSNHIFSFYHSDVMHTSAFKVTGYYTILRCLPNSHYVQQTLFVRLSSTKLLNISGGSKAKSHKQYLQSWQQLFQQRTIKSIQVSKICQTVKKLRKTDHFAQK